MKIKSKLLGSYMILGVSFTLVSCIVLSWLINRASTQELSVIVKDRLIAAPATPPAPVREHSSLYSL